MNKLKCILIDDEQHARNLMQFFIEKDDRVEVVGKFRSVQEFESTQETINFDFVFLDINMPNKSGVQLAEEQPNLNIVFTTAYEEYALKSYDVNALDYVLKPINLDKIQTTISKVIIHFDLIQKSKKFESISLKKSNFLEMTIGRTSYRILKDDIVYISSDNEYVRVVTKNDSQLIYCRLKEMKKLLGSEEFIQIHRSHIVNTTKIVRFNSNQIELPNKVELPISRSFKKEVNEKLNN